jgi:hypothetical protein
MRPSRLLAAAAVAACASAASAERVDLLIFENVTNTPTTGLDLWVDVTDGGTHVDFTFHNDSTVSSIITSIYVENTAFTSAAFSSAAIVAQSAGVSFSAGATPPNPPGSISGWGGAWGGNVFSADNDPPASKGINPGEWLTIRFALAGYAFADVIDELSSDPVGFRIAEHIQSIGQDSVSMWGVNGPIESSVVPLPPAAWSGLALLGLAGIARARHARARR